jgi:hypothetical protein
MLKREDAAGDGDARLAALVGIIGENARRSST